MKVRRPRSFPYAQSTHSQQHVAEANLVPPTEQLCHRVAGCLLSRLADLREQLCQVSPPSKESKKMQLSWRVAIPPSLSAELIASKAVQLHGSQAPHLFWRVFGHTSASLFSETVCVTLLLHPATKGVEFGFISTGWE